LTILAGVSSWAGWSGVAGRALRSGLSGLAWWAGFARRRSDRDADLRGWLAGESGGAGWSGTTGAAVLTGATGRAGRAGQATVLATAGHLPLHDGTIAGPGGDDLADRAFLFLEFVDLGHHVLSGQLAHGQFIVDSIMQMLYVIVDGR
jgi:hypothetical protein